MSQATKVFTKASIIAELKKIRDRGWIPNVKPGNDGGVGNTLEYLLGIRENNLPIANAAEWELKSQRSTTNSLLTLFHYDPSPRTLNLITRMLLPQYGWRHKKAGTEHDVKAMSFRVTINTLRRSDRGFKVVVNRNIGRVEISFDSKSVGENHEAWLREVEKKSWFR